MSDSKKDLTRIEDLGEYLHELNEEAESEDAGPMEVLPDLPPETMDFGETTFESDPFPGSETSFTTDSEDETPNFSLDEAPAEPSESSEEIPETEFLEDEEEEEEETFIQEESNFTPTEAADFSKDEEISEISNFETPAFEDVDFDDKETHEEKTAPYQQPETFEDLKKFAEKTTPVGMGAEGNPSFSVLLRNIKFIEDVNDILSLLKELQLLSDTEDLVKQRLMRGHLLIPRISEYAAIFLAHKLRRFDIDIQVGLSDEIHPPKHQETPETGLISKNNLYQNQSHHFHFDNAKLDLSQIIISTSSQLSDHQVIKYIGVATEHKMLDSYIVENETSDEIPVHYSELANKLKAHALKANANAVIGLSYQLTPIPSDYGGANNKYRLSCTGNLVWINRL